MNGLKERFYQKVFSQDDNPVIEGDWCNICDEKMIPQEDSGGLRIKELIIDHIGRTHNLLNVVWSTDSPSNTPIEFINPYGCTICCRSQETGRVEHTCRNHPYLVNILNQVEKLKKH